MKMIKMITSGALMVAMTIGGALYLSRNSQAEPAAKLEIDGIRFQSRLKAPEGHVLDEIISGWEFRSKATQVVELDDFQNPGMLAVALGEELWSTVDGTENKSCASCHGAAGAAGEAMKKAGSSHPKWDKNLKKPVNLEQRINLCRKQMGAAPWKWETKELLAMTSFVRHQSRGLPMNVKIDGPMAPWFERGKKLYYTRFGQLDMSCSNCHEDHYGERIRADRLSQGQINGFPTYRLKWQNVGSVHRRFKGCMKQIRAKPYKVGSDEFLALETYLSWRGQGLSIETPAVRQ